MKLKIPKLSYKQKTLRNIFVIILLLVFVWINADCPLLTAEMNFRRQEHKRLLEASEIVLHVPEKEGYDLFVGRGESYAVAAEVNNVSDLNFYYWSFGEGDGVKLITSPGFHSCQFDDEPLSCRKAVALDMPEGAGRAELKVFQRELMNVVYRAEGERLEDSVWLFHMNDGQNAPPGWDYELTMYGSGEEILLVQEGELRRADYKW